MYILNIYILECHSYCQSCTGPSNLSPDCENCIATNPFDTTNGCECKITAGYYEVQNVDLSLNCLPCHEYCSSCSQYGLEINPLTDNCTCLHSGIIPLNTPQVCNCNEDNGYFEENPTGSRLQCTRTNIYIYIYII